MVPQQDIERMKQLTRKEFVALGGALGAALSVGITFPKAAVAGTPDAIDEVWSDPATDTTIVAAARSLGTAPLRLEVSENSNFASSTLHPAQAVSPDAQGYAKVTATGLKPNTQYHYRWRSNGALATRAKGKCKTLATFGVPTSFKFVSLSCIRTAANDDYFASHLAQLDSAFTLFSGDFYYEVKGQDTSLAKTFRDNWHKPHMRCKRVAWLKSQGHKVVWGDHDYLGNNSDGTSPNGDIARDVYRQVVPHSPLPRTDDIGSVFHQWTRSVFFDGRSEQAQSISSHRRLYQDDARGGAEVGLEGVAARIQELSQGYRVTTAVARYLDKTTTTGVPTPPSEQRSSRIARTTVSGTS